MTKGKAFGTSNAGMWRSRYTPEGLVLWSAHTPDGDDPPGRDLTAGLTIAGDVPR